MQKNLFFLICAAALLILSIICIFIGPNINDKIYDLQILISGNYPCTKTPSLNCQKMEDDYNFHIENNFYFANETHKKLYKKEIDECKKLNAMKDLEFSSFIIDVVLGFICFFLGLIHYLDQGKPFEKYSGLIGTISGVITAVLTIIYVGYSASILNNQHIRNRYYPMLYENKALYHWNGNKYILPYDEAKLNNDLDVQYIKIKDLGKKQYNYNSKFYQMTIDDDSEYKNCIIGNTFSITTQKKYYINRDNENEKKCDYIWNSNPEGYYYGNINNKFIYDRWLTTIILGVIIGVCGLGLALFGILLFL